MMASPIPQKALCDALRDAIGDSHVEAALFTTYAFEPSFFEENVLPVLWDKTLSHNVRARLAQMERELLKMNTDIAVYYDRAGLDTSASPLLRVKYHGIVRKRGTRFHPKVVLALVAKDGERRLLVCVSSANLTEAGYFTNLECAHIEEVYENGRCSFRDALRTFLQNIRRSMPPETEHAALDAIARFLHRSVGNDDRGKKWLYVGGESLTDFLEPKLVRGVRDRCELEIVSPYFDEEDAAPLKALQEALSPRETRIYLPTDEHGNATCSAEYFATVKKIATWSDLPAEHLRSSEKDNKALPRRVHAKHYRILVDDGREYSLVGSVNLTNAAHDGANKGNQEAAFFIQEKQHSGPRPLLEPLDKKREPKKFLEAKDGGSDDVATDVVILPLTLVYDWSERTAHYFWDKKVGKPPSSMAISSAGVPITTISLVVGGEWQELLPNAARSLGEKLRGTSFVTVKADDLPEVIMLVEETGLKPSCVAGLRWTAEDILLAWSSLSDEQRQIVLERSLEIAGSLGDTGGRTESLENAGKSLFDTVAGIYQGFFRLEERVIGAVEKGRHKEADFLLFGTGYDTLPALLDQIEKDEAGDRVKRYITLLCAEAIFTRLLRREGAMSNFLAERQDKKTEIVRRAKKSAERIRETFSFGDDVHRQKFFKWFERWFQKNVMRDDEEDAG
ncbi:MAG: hypothetical protein IPM54_02160 [Polyangiaceae bacterium]|nr:hypothetical protein [Polyangiaceae bacterium]